MTPDEAIIHVLEALDRARIPYVLVGSIASNFHGIPRSTRDVDLVVELPGSHRLQALRDTLVVDLVLHDQMAFETVTGTARYLIELRAQPFVCELFVLSDDPHDIERFARRQQVVMLGRPIWVATVEDMIVTKLRWALGASRSKDRDDVRNMLAVQAERLDLEYIDRWSAIHGTTDLLAEIRRSLPH